MEILGSCATERIDGGKRRDIDRGRKVWKCRFKVENDGVMLRRSLFCQ